MAVCEKKSIKMEQKNKIKDVLQKMKARRGNNTLVLFRNGDNFEAYGNDAKIIAGELPLHLFTKEQLPAISFPHHKQEEYSNHLLDKGYTVCISEMRDAGGNYIIDIAEET